MLTYFFLICSIYSIACEVGWFGPDCNTSCGHCGMHDVCFYTNGTCPDNCTDGYIGDKCIDREFDWCHILFFFISHLNMCKSQTSQECVASYKSIDYQGTNS